MTLMSAAIERLGHADAVSVSGRIATMRGLTIEAHGLPAPVGALASIHTTTGNRLAEVVGFTTSGTILMLLDGSQGVCSGDRVTLLQSRPTILASDDLLGRVIDALGNPIDGGQSLTTGTPVDIHPDPVSPLRRSPIHQQLSTGIKPIDVMTPVGVGQRVGIFAGPGVGKSTLLGMIARNTEADVNVIALIGERGREVREFLLHALGDAGLQRSVVVAATSEQSPVIRTRAAYVAASIAEHFRDQGKSVMLMLDSVTRFAHAQRQIGLSIGEPPATRGYTPSVFAALPTLLERAGAVDATPGKRAGSITAFYTTLIEGDDMTEPVADAVRGILDGHIVLSRKLAQRAHFPAIDPLDSVSRVADAVAQRPHIHARNLITQLLAAYKDSEELINIGAYASGSNALTDAAINLKPAIDELLQQAHTTRANSETSIRSAMDIAAQAERALTVSSGRPVTPGTI